MKKRIMSIIITLIIILSFMPKDFFVKAMATGIENIEITNFMVNRDTPQVLGKELTLSAMAIGGENIKYRFVAQSGTYKEVIQDFSNNNVVNWTPKKAGIYSLFFVAKNDVGETITKSITKYEIKESLNLQIKRFGTNKVSPQNINTPIELSVEGEGTGKLQYRFVAQSGTYKEVIQDFSYNNVVNWTPKASGRYSLFFVIKDDQSKTITKSITNYVISDSSLRIDSFGMDKLSPQKVGNNINLNIKADAVGDIKYRFVAYSGGYSEVISDFSSKNNVVWTPKKAGIYNVYFVAKNDSNIRVEKVIYNYQIQENLSIQNTNAELISPQEIGSKIKLTTIAKGIGKLQYRFVAYSGTYKEVIQDFSTNNVVTWIPSKSGTYNLYFVVKDESGTTVNL